MLGIGVSHDKHAISSSVSPGLDKANANPNLSYGFERSPTLTWWKELQTGRACSPCISGNIYGVLHQTKLGISLNTTHAIAKLNALGRFRKYRDRDFQILFACFKRHAMCKAIQQTTIRRKSNIPTLGDRAEMCLHNFMGVSRLPTLLSPGLWPSVVLETATASPSQATGTGIARTVRRRA